MHPTGSVTGWSVDRAAREALLDRFPPRYSQAVADHVTLDVGAKDKPLPGQVNAKIVGHADDGRGVEAMIVAIDGSTDRPDGSTFHITWSLDQGRRAKESNDVIAKHGWSEIEAVPVALRPARF